MPKTEQNKRASCSECPGTFELVPPADAAYTEPHEKPSSDDYLKRVYECNEEHHRNTIYWEKHVPIVVSSSYATPEMNERHSRRNWDDVSTVFG